MVNANSKNQVEWFFQFHYWFKNLDTFFVPCIPCIMTGWWQLSALGVVYKKNTDWALDFFYFVKAIIFVVNHNCRNSNKKIKAQPEQI